MDDRRDWTHQYDKCARRVGQTQPRVVSLNSAGASQLPRQFRDVVSPIRFGEEPVEQYTTYQFEVSAQKSVPEAIVAFLDSSDFESAVRNAVWLGGDADTQACIAGALAEAYYGGVPTHIATETQRRLDPEIVRVLELFNHVI